MVEDNGSTVIGFLLGFFLSCIGLIGALAMGKPNTKKGAVIGFVVAIVLWICTGVLLGGLQVVLNAAS